MNQDKNSCNKGAMLRWSLLVPMALIIASIIACCLSYSDAKRSIAADLNSAALAFANENSGLWTRPDTIAAIRHIYETTHKPLIYQASDINFSNATLKDEAYFTLSPADEVNGTQRTQGNTIVSDSILLVSESATDGLAIRLQCFADISMTAVFLASNQTIPGILLCMAILSLTSAFIWHRKNLVMSEMSVAAVTIKRASLDGIKLTPMQRQLATMLLEAPGMRVGKRTLCETLWGDKSNAEESLYTLIRRTKAALVKSNIEIICNRGESYEIHINN